MENKDKEQHRKKSYFWLSFNEVLTAGISIAGIIFVVITLKSNEHAISTGTYLQTYGWTLEIDKILIENPKLRHYFTDGDSLKIQDDSSAYIKVEAMADYMLDNFDAVLNNTSYFERHDAAGKAWKKSVSNYFSKSPILCQRFLIDPEVYNPALKEAYALSQRRQCLRHPYSAVGINRDSLTDLPRIAKSFTNNISKVGALNEY